MARKKGRYNAIADRQTETAAGSIAEENTVHTYKAALYARISAEHRDRESDSLESQFLLLEEYVRKRPQFAGYREFSDRNYSGTNFNRPGFQEMMSEIREGRINCVIVKDLSRLGRDYLEAGNYIETIFPFLGVRFISVNDHFDTDDAKNGNRALSISLMNLVNDMYARDISRKMTSTTRANIRRGSYVGSNAPYGYRVVETERGYGFVVDENAAGIVKKMFDWYLELGTISALARRMTEERIRVPGDYLSNPIQLLGEDEPVKVWSETTIRQILVNEAYIGHMVQGKTRQHRYEGIAATSVAREEWVKVEHTHEPIISEETFRRVSDMLYQRRKSGRSRTDRFPIEEDIFDGFLFCPICGQKIRQISSMKKDGVKRNYYYFCSHKTMADAKEHENCTIAKYELLDAIGKAIRGAVQHTPVDAALLLEQLDQKSALLSGEYRKRKKELSGKNRALETEGMEHYQDYVTGKITKEHFQSENQKLEERKESIRKDLLALRNEEQEQQKKIRDMKTWLNGFLKCEGAAVPDRELLFSLVKRIWLYPGRRLRVEFLFGGSMEAACDRNTHVCTVGEACRVAEFLPDVTTAERERGQKLHE